MIYTRFAVVKRKYNIDEKKERNVYEPNNNSEINVISIRTHWECISNPTSVHSTKWLSSLTLAVYRDAVVRFQRTAGGGDKFRRGFPTSRGAKRR